MQKLSETKTGETAVISVVEGDTRFLSRITSIGLTIGSRISVIQNVKKRPLLIYSRDTVISLNKEECSKIMVEVRA
ncbi:MAG: FeoA family protein [Lachnospiraceae bacterium]